MGAVIVRPKSGGVGRDNHRALLAGSLNDRSTRGLLRAPDGVTLFCRLKLIRSGYLPITLEMRSPLKIALVIVALSARRMKTSQSYIARIEGGKVRPSTDALERFAHATRARHNSMNDIISNIEPLPC